MTVIKQVEFFPFNENSTVKPQAGKYYLVVLESFGAFTRTETAQYINRTFKDIDSKYLGFAQFQGTDQERDLMEVYGSSSKRYKLLDNVLGWAELPLVDTNELLTG